MFIRFIYIDEITDMRYASN